MARTDRDLKVALARAVAGREIDAKAIDSVAAKLNKYEYKIRGINPCIYGICLDFFVEKPEINELLGKALEVGRIRELTVFPWGIPWPDLFHVRIEQQFEGIPDAELHIGH